MKTNKFENATFYTFENKNGMIMEVSDFGAILKSLMVPDKDGNLVDVVLGFDSVDEYAKCTNGFGATIGRNGNRIAKAKFTLNDKTYELEKNNNGNNLHSGTKFYQHRMWSVKETTANSITFSLHSPDGDQGFPGNFDVDVTYTLTDDNELKIDYNGTPDQDTVVNMTNHSYFNLNGHASGNILEQEVWVDADTFLPTDAELIPTGEICPVEGTPMDFRVKKPVGRDIEEDYEALKLGGGYDHNWCLNNNGKFAKVIEMSAKESGITMEVYTDLPGVQIYSGNFLVKEIGKGGAEYKHRQAICFETQGYPDAINHDNFPSVVCKAGEVYKTTTIYKFV